MGAITAEGENLSKNLFPSLGREKNCNFFSPKLAFFFIRVLKVLATRSLSTFSPRYRPFYAERRFSILTLAWIFRGYLFSECIQDTVVEKRAHRNNRRKLNR